jgi:hypothetical protein
MNKNEQGMRERGQALVLVMLVLMVVVILGSATVTLTASHRQTAARQRNHVQAYYAADAGVERALVMIRQNPGLLKDPSRLEKLEKDLSGESYAGGEIERVTVEEEEIPDGPGTGVEITSVGTFNKARKTLAVRARVFAPGDLLKGVSILPEEQGYELKITGNFTLRGENSNSRPVFLVNGSLEVSGSAQIKDFDIYASGNIVYKDEDKNLQDCNIHPNYPAIPPFPVLDEEWYQQQAKEYYPGDTTFPQESQKRNHGKGQGQNTQEGDNGKGQGQEGNNEDVAKYSGVYFVDGDVKLSGTYSGQAVIVALGDIEVTDDLLAGDPDEDLLVLISLGGGVDIKKGNSIVDALIITNGTFSAQGGAELYGGIIARQLDPNGSVTIICDPALIERNQDLLRMAFGGSSKPVIRIESWSEQ